MIIINVKSKVCNAVQKSAELMQIQFTLAPKQGSQNVLVRKCVIYEGLKRYYGDHFDRSSVEWPRPAT